MLQIRDLRSFEIRIRFERDWPIRKFSNESAVPAPLLVVSLVKRLKPLTALSGTAYRLASSMSDHTPVVNVFEDCNEQYVVPHISFASLVIADFNN